MQGGNPYSVFGFYNPPWIIPLLLPLSIGSAKYSQSLMFVVSILSAIYLCRKMEFGLVGTAAYLLSAPSLLILNLGNIEHILLLALLLPTEWAILAFLIKPQIGLGFILYQAIVSYREEGWAGLSRLISLPTVTIMVISFLVFGYTKMTPSMMPWNLNLFPYLLPPALFILFLAIKHKKPEYGLVASLGFSPYITMNSFLVVGVGLRKHKAFWMVLYCIVSWILQTIHILTYTGQI
jgi:hypothetical protein